MRRCHGKVALSQQIVVTRLTENPGSGAHLAAGLRGGGWTLRFFARCTERVGLWGREGRAVDGRCPLCRTFGGVPWKPDCT